MQIMNIRGVASVTKTPCGEHAPHCQFLPMQALRGKGPETRVRMYVRTVVFVWTGRFEQ